ncbi:MAG: glycosyltransferase family 4 protein [Candidatus Roizmanbacteria bacterium]
MKILIFANIVHTNTLAGGDRIFIECANKWIQRNHEVTIVTNEVGKAYSLKGGIPPSSISVWSASWADAMGVYIAMTIKAVVGLVHGIFAPAQEVDIVFASSFFAPDLLPALLVKIKYPRAKLLVGTYLLTHKRWGTDYSAGKMKGLLFYFNQCFLFWAIHRYGGKILTASAYDKTYLISSSGLDESSVLPFRGGVDCAYYASVPSQPITYDAIFVGRFHPQKCISELIDIWSGVVRTIPKAKLALVGNGRLEKDLRAQVVKRGLEKNIDFLGPQEGVPKAILLKSSKFFVTASRYDSGNIALDEALACGTPGMVYHLPYLHYPKGVIKIPDGDQRLYIKILTSAIQDDALRARLASQALDFVASIDWGITSEVMLQFA